LIEEGIVIVSAVIAYPFTAPAVRPAMKERCMKRYMATIGTEATITAVNIIE
jgi:hypothetical protein